MNSRRRLSLKSETLAELSADDLQLVAGGAGALSDQYGNCTIDNSYRICSLRCQMTFNTCAC